MWNEVIRMRSPLYENALMDGVVEEHIPYSLIEGALEKSKLRKDTFLRFGKRKSKAKWTRRYFVLRCGDVPDAFFLDQYSDATSTSKIRRTLDMERVSQVDTNVSSKDGTKNWIFSIHFTSATHLSKFSVLYLAASSEEEMNRWVAQLCYACNLEKQEDTEPYGTSPNTTLQQDTKVVNVESRSRADGGDCLSRSFESFVGTPSSESSLVETFLDEHSKQKNSGNYTLLKNCGSGTALTNCEDPRSSSEETHIQTTTTHPYIHLKNCTSTRPKDIEANGTSRHQRNDSSGSLSVSSSRASSSADSDCAQTDLPSRNTPESLVPPPRPPKGTHLNARREDIREELFEIYSNGPFHLDQTLPPPHLDEIGIEEDHGWSGETIKPVEKVLESSEPQAGPSWEAPLPFTMSKTPLNRAGLTPGLLSDSQLVPPKVDRSCKPHRRGVSADETNAPTSSLDRINSFVKRNDKHSYSGPCPPIVQPRKSSEGSNQMGSPKPRPSVPPIPRTNPLNRIQREPKPPAALPPPPTSPPPSSGMLEYFDPIEGVTVLRSASAASVAGEAGVAKVEAPTRTAHSVEYVLIDEQSTKAVFEANMQQSELRSMGKPLG